MIAFSFICMSCGNRDNTILTVYQIIFINNKFYRRSHSFLFWLFTIYVFLNMQGIIVFINPGQSASNCVFRQISFAGGKWRRANGRVFARRKQYLQRYMVRQQNPHAQNSITKKTFKKRV